MLGASGPAGLICSRAGCEKAAQHEVVWRNPKIHSEDREKIWLSCDEHQGFFVEYLGARNFSVHVRPVEHPQ